MMKKEKLMNPNEATAIKLYELKYIDQETFFELLTGSGEQTELEDGVNRFIFYLKLVANSEKDGHENDSGYFISPYLSSPESIITRLF